MCRLRVFAGGFVHVSVIARTNYAVVADGGLDLLWQPDGRHTAGQGYIGAEKDPLGGSFRVQRHTVHDGDILWGGERCETMTPKIGGGPGSRFQVGFKLLLPVGFQSGSGGWNSLWDLHYPNNGPAQSPMTVSVRSSNELWVRILGGPLSSDGTMGTVRVEKRVATLAHGRWYSLAWDIGQGDPFGIFDTFVDGVLVDSQRTPTISNTPLNSTYWKTGFYRSASSSGTASYLFGDTVCVNGGMSELLPLLGVAAAPPPPVAPDPSAAQKAIDAIRAANPKIAAAVQATLDYAKEVGARP